LPRHCRVVEPHDSSLSNICSTIHKRQIPFIGTRFLCPYEGELRQWPMPYIEGRVVHDADAHIMETPNWLRGHADPDVRDRIEPLQLSGGNELKQTGDPEEQLRDLDAAFDKLKAKHASEKYRADEAAEIMQRKNFAATGSFIAEDRPRALDLIGVASQLVF